MIFKDKMRAPRAGWRMDSDFFYREHLKVIQSGMVIFDMRDADSGEQIAYWEHKNIISLDASLLAGLMLSNPSAHNGLNMLAIGSGATGNLLSPDAPQATQRRLNNELERKAFSRVQNRDSNGIAVAIPTNIVDYTAVFSEGEAVGPLNEMMLIAAYSTNPTIKNPILNGPTGYDATYDVSDKDIGINYLTFGILSKPSSAVLGITWRITF